MEPAMACEYGPCRETRENRRQVCFRLYESTGRVRSSQGPIWQSIGAILYVSSTFFLVANPLGNRTQAQRRNLRRDEFRGRCFDVERDPPRSKVSCSLTSWTGARRPSPGGHARASRATLRGMPELRPCTKVPNFRHFRFEPLPRPRPA